jgi:Protein of unknown function (DUF998)
MAKVTVTRRTPSEPAPRANPRRALALVGMIGPVLYILLVTALGLLWEGYDPVRDTQSELGAVDSPYRGLMNIAGFMGLSVSILAFSAAYFLLLRKGFVTTLAAGLLAIAGVGMVVVGFFPCDAGCVDVTRTGRLHSVFSIPGAVGLPLAAMVSAAVFRRDGRFGAAWQVLSFWLGLVSLGSGPIIAAELVQGTNGLLQRAAMWPSLVWMVAMSTKLHSLAWIRSPSVPNPTPCGGLLGRAGMAPHAPPPASDERSLSSSGPGCTATPPTGRSAPRWRAGRGG